MASEHSAQGELIKSRGETKTSKYIFVTPPFDITVWLSHYL